ncbi:MAG: hypothetical protein R2776_04525 [Flavobacteriaceae bacterium]|nr:hypothetical protein [Flavobacteriaceae bacterium]
MITTKIKDNLVLIIGFVITSMVYLLNRLSNSDVFEYLLEVLAFWEPMELDELILVWLIPFSVFWVINEYLKIKKKYLEQKEKVYHNIVYASNHILRNFLLQSQILKIEAEENSSFNKEVIEIFDKCILDAENQIIKLSKLKSLEEEDIFNSIKIKKTLPKPPIAVKTPVLNSF